ncbi:hypothetical protein DZF91_10865 [Actinomadura logoneensis]|uniref:Uncharacterized protein n=1 Tax=Actinomadura logoneensis TaxID=2293572 RepID=A0A372JNR8_9ACTN|nr:hypothetical protein DZF91_10865 [Actinomadura logoneensis]
MTMPTPGSVLVNPILRSLSVTPWPSCRSGISGAPGSPGRTTGMSLPPLRKYTVLLTAGPSARGSGPTSVIPVAGTPHADARARTATSAATARRLIGHPPRAARA